MVLSGQTTVSCRVSERAPRMQRITYALRPPATLPGFLSLVSLALGTTRVISKRHRVFMESTRTVTTVELVVENFLGVILGLLGGVGVVQVGLVAAGDLSISRHPEGWLIVWRDCVLCEG